MSEDIEARLDRLEAVQAISELRARYCLYADASAWSDLAQLFDEHAVFVGLGTAKGRSEIEKVFAVVPEAMDAWWHFVHNEITDVVGDQATGYSYFDAPCVIAGVPYVCAGRYDERFIRRNGKWLFAERRLTFFYQSPLADGWGTGEGPFTPSPAAAPEQR
jgi:hypothetical protein